MIKKERKIFRTFFFSNLNVFFPPSLLAIVLIKNKFGRERWLEKVKAAALVIGPRGMF